MGRVAFLFCVHNHQPVGNFEHVLEQAYRKAYLPFLEVLKKYPFMNATLHYSGVLWGFFKRNHPPFFTTLKQLTQSGQVEIMTGGYYEPILAVIPDEHKLGQIRKLSQAIEDETGAAPRGLWLAERVWEPHLPECLFKAGVEYTTVDDHHFKKAGFREDELYGYYVTEENGFPLKVFPGSEKLRYIIPFRPPEETLDYLSRLRDSGGAAIFADDGEKFGVWPYTYHSVYEEAWLERLFQLIEKNLDWIEPMSLGAYAARRAPLGRVYLPSSSYVEMDAWSLPTESRKEYGKVIEALKERADGDQIRKFIQGGFWRNFFVKYPESNDLHKRVLHLAAKVKEDSGREELIDYLYGAECNDAYWHGVFGGLYLPHLRHALYQNLIAAETLYDESTRSGQKWTDMERGDVNLDGKEEILLKNASSIALLSARGGSLLEMDYRPKRFNVLATLTPREEGYHRKVLEQGSERPADKARSIHEIFDAKEGDLEPYLRFGRYRKTSFLDHFVTDPLDMQSVRDGTNEEGDFVAAAYEASLTTRGDNRVVTFSRTGEKIPIFLEKQILFSGERAALKAAYRVMYEGKSERRTNFGIEFNINLLAGDAPDRYYEIPGHTLRERHLASSGEEADVREMNLVDQWAGIRVSLKPDRPARLFRYPLYTVSISEGGFEKIFQGSCIMLFWPLELIPGGSFTVGVEIEICPL
jgi:4-alpha-glucanotransferase